MNLEKYQIACINTGETYLTIPAAGTTAATPFNCSATPPLAFVTPTTWEACDVTFKVLPFSADLAAAPGNVVNGDLATLYKDDGSGDEFTFITKAGKGQYPLPPTIFNSVQFINITCGSAQTTGGQVMLVLQPIWQGIHN